MHFVQGDYISCVWVYESPDAIWTVLVAWRILTKTWEVSITLDPYDPATDVARSSDPIQTIKLRGDLLEDEVLAAVDDNVKMFEIAGLSRRIAFLEIHSDDPQALIGAFEALAMENERFGCSIVVREIPELEE